MQVAVQITRYSQRGISPWHKVTVRQALRDELNDCAELGAVAPFIIEGEQGYLIAEQVSLSSCAGFFEIVYKGEGI